MLIIIFLKNDNFSVIPEISISKDWTCLHRESSPTICLWIRNAAKSYGTLSRGGFSRASSFLFALAEGGTKAGTGKIAGIVRIEKGGSKTREEKHEHTSAVPFNLRGNIFGARWPSSVFYKVVTKVALIFDRARKLLAMCPAGKYCSTGLI